MTLRLEWKTEPGFGDVLRLARAGILTLAVRDRVTHAQWHIDVRGICGDYTDAPTVDAAQHAAESAALDLGLAVVAALAGGHPHVLADHGEDGAFVAGIRTADIGHGAGLVVVADRPEQAIALGAALVKAGMAAKGGA